MTVLVLPLQGGGVQVYATPADLPADATDGTLASVISDQSVRQWQAGTSTWVVVADGSLVYVVSDTNSIDLTNTAGTITADLRLSGVAAGSGFVAVSLDIQSDGLRAQLSEANVRGLFSWTDTTTINGAYNSGVGLMRDDLRSKGLLPVTSPYTQAVASAQASVFSVTGTQAIVDWVLVEVRNSATPTTVVVRQAALLQRDGDVVAINGSSTLTATLAAGNYYVSIRHRNHLGVMTGTPVALSTSSALIDFTGMSATYGANAQRLANGLYQLWAGDTNGNGQVSGAGPGNELNPILGDVLTAPGNAEHNRNYIVVGYSNGDVNLDGQVIAAGPGNDINSIYNGVFLHPANASIAANYIVQERLP